ncbi:hypothetical protein OKW40_004081 [Paraburkholderia sp. RAU6.4a]|uniref:integrase domain-containing protein n=1 Tax=Paraburkholderia sp. RAU6.4a TaxID=2991067 RepID=UPI003D1AFD4F
MSKTGDLIHEACVARENSSKGAKESAQNSLDIWRPYARFLKQINCLPRKVKDIPPAAFMLYVHYELSKGIVVSTMKNRTTDIRVVSGRCGKNIDHFTNRFLGIPNRSLHGKKQAIPDDEYKRALDFAARTNRGFEFILRFQRLLGLRRREAIQCAESLPEWLASLENGGNTVYVTRGTKNGRHRTVSVLAAHRTATIQVIKAALDYSHQFNPPRFLTNRGMKRVLNSVSARYRRAGLKGKFSSHACRYAFAEDTATVNLDSGISPRSNSRRR